MGELGKFWASAPHKFSVRLILNGKIATCHCLDIAGGASSILATPTIENPVRPGAWRGFCLPGGGGRPSLAPDLSGQILGILHPVWANFGRRNGGRTQSSPDSFVHRRPACAERNQEGASMFAPAFDGAGWWPAGRRGSRRAAGKTGKQKASSDRQ